MIPAKDLWMLGLKPASASPVARMIPSSGAAQPLRETDALFPDWAALPVRRLTLGLTCSLHRRMAHRLVAAFRAAHPDVDLIIEVLLESDLVDRFKGHRIDAAIAPNNATQGAWHVMPLWRERLIAAMAEAAPLAQANTVPPGRTARPDHSAGRRSVGPERLPAGGGERHRRPSGRLSALSSGA